MKQSERTNISDHADSCVENRLTSIISSSSNSLNELKGSPSSPLSSQSDISNLISVCSNSSPDLSENVLSGKKRRFSRVINHSLHPNISGINDLDTDPSLVTCQLSSSISPPHVCPLTIVSKVLLSTCPDSPSTHSSLEENSQDIICSSIHPVQSSSFTVRGSPVAKRQDQFGSRSRLSGTDDISECNETIIDLTIPITYNTSVIPHKKIELFEEADCSFNQLNLKNIIADNNPTHSNPLEQETTQDSLNSISSINFSENFKRHHSQNSLITNNQQLTLPVISSPKPNHISVSTFSPQLDSQCVQSLDSKINSQKVPLDSTHLFESFNHSSLTTSSYYPFNSLEKKDCITNTTNHSIHKTASFLSIEDDTDDSDFEIEDNSTSEQSDSDSEEGWSPEELKEELCQLISASEHAVDDLLCCRKKNQTYLSLNKQDDTTCHSGTTYPNSNRNDNYDNTLPLLDKQLKKASNYQHVTLFHTTTAPIGHIAVEKSSSSSSSLEQCHSHLQHFISSTPIETMTATSEINTGSLDMASQGMTETNVINSELETLLDTDPNSIPHNKANDKQIILIGQGIPLNTHDHPYCHIDNMDIMNNNSHIDERGLHISPDRKKSRFVSECMIPSVVHSDDNHDCINSFHHNDQNISEQLTLLETNTSEKHQTDHLSNERVCHHSSFPYTEMTHHLPFNSNPGPVSPTTGSHLMTHPDIHDVTSHHLQTLSPPTTTHQSINVDTVLQSHKSEQHVFHSSNDFINGTLLNGSVELLQYPINHSDLSHHRPLTDFPQEDTPSDDSSDIIPPEDESIIIGGLEDQTVNHLLPSDHHWNQSRLQQLHHDFSNCHQLPPPRPNEIEFIFENVLSIRENPSSPDRYWSQSKTHQSVTFRLLIFPKGNKNFRPGNLSAYVAVDPSDSFPPRFKNMWVMHRCDYQLFVIHWRNWRDCSILKNEHFSFSSDDIDRGWVDLVPADGLKIGEFLGPSGQLILRAQICPRAIDASNHHFLGRRDVGYIGIRNQGATCYLNSLVQALFHIGAFRKSVFQLTQEYDKMVVNNDSLKYQSDPSPSHVDSMSDGENEDDSRLPWTENEIRQAFEEDEDNDTSIGEGTGFHHQGIVGGSHGINGDSKVSLALQSLFLKLTTSNDVATTDELIKSFGWESNESLTQHDAQELNRLLCDRLEEQMKGTPSEGAIQRLFMGEFENYVECIDVPYESSRREMFYDLQLDVQNTTDMYESLNKYTAEEVLEGDNLYDAEEFGRQRARKGVRFIRFPPVIQFHLKRFTFDPSRMDMIKINQRFEYPQTLDLSKILPGAGTYDLFCVIVHAGDVGGGHYYVMNRPGGHKWWMKFDDEKVYPVSPHSVLTDSYGGHDAVCWDHIKAMNDPHYKPELPSVKLHSAYILFYVKSDMSEELLEEPNPDKVNPYLLQRRRWEEEKKRKQLQIQRYVQNYVKARYITETSLRGYKGFLTDIHTIPAVLEARFPRTTTMLDVWKSLDAQIIRGELNDPLLCDLQKIHYHGLWYFDGSINNKASNRIADIRPLPCHLSESAKRQFSIGDHVTWITRGLRKPWSPTLALLVHPLFLRDKTDIRSVALLNNTILDFKFFIGKFFNPGPFGTPPSSQYIIVAGIPVLRFKKDKRQSPIVSLFIELLRTLVDTPAPIFDDPIINDFILQSIKLYAHNRLPGPDDPLNVSERCYLESGGTFEHLTGVPSSIIERIESPMNFKMDEQFPPVIVFSLPSDPQSLERRTIAENYGMTEDTLDIYENDLSIITRHTSQNVCTPPIESTLHCLENNTTTVSQSQDIIISTIQDDLLTKLVHHTAEQTTNCSPSKQDYDDIYRHRVIDTKTYDGSLSPYIPCRDYPPCMPQFVSCYPDDWSLALTRSKITVILQLHDPLSVLSRWEDASGHVVYPVLINDQENPSTSFNDSEAIYEKDQRLESGLMGQHTFLHQTRTDLDTTNGYVLRCPPIKEVQVEVDLRWPYRLAMKRLCWHLGIHSDSCVVHPGPPLVSDVSTFSPLYSPSSTECLSSLSWGIGRHSSLGTGNIIELPNRLDELHSFFAQRQNISRYRDIKSSTDSLYHSGIQYHFSLLPRPITHPSLGYLHHTCDDASVYKQKVDKSSTENRIILVRIFNSKVENVGSVLVDIDTDHLCTVTEFISQAQQLITPVMEQRGAVKNCAYKLVWTGLSYPDHGGIHQISIVPNRLEIVTDQIFNSRIPLLSRGFQFDTPLRLEPDFSEQQHRDLSVSDSLPLIVCLADQLTTPRALRLTVLHQNRERQYFGYPFFIIVSSRDTLKTMKEKIQEKLGFSDVAFSKWKFFVFDYEHTSFVKDDEVPDFSRGRPPCLLAVHRSLYAPEDRTRSLQLHIK